MRFPIGSSLIVLALAAGLTATPAGVQAREAGVAAAVNADSKTLPPQQAEQTLVVGHNVVFDEKITTGPAGQAQLLMLDQSAVTVAQNSSLVIDKFVYDPDTKTGEMALSLSRGLMRFVGGRLSKNGKATVRTPVATMGIRGGIAIFNVINERTVDVTLLFGEGVEGVTNDGKPFAVRRKGYFTRIETGQEPTPPEPAGSENVGQSLAQLEGRSTATAGAPEAPTEQDAVQQIGDAPPPPPPPVVSLEPGDGGQEAAPPEGIEEEVAPINNPDEETLGVDQAVLEEFGFSGGAALNQRFNSKSRIVRLQQLGGQDLGAGENTFFEVQGATNVTLLAPVNNGPLLFRPGGDGDPNAVPNIFNANDPTLFVSPQQYEANIVGAAGAELGSIFEPVNIGGDGFFNYDLSSADFNGIVGSRITIFGGRQLFQKPSGRSFFEPNQDSQLLSLLPFSELGAFQLPNGAGIAGAVKIPDADIQQTPILVDWDTGKLLYLGGVFHNINGAGDRAAGIQVLVGNLEGGNGAPALFVGQNAGGTHLEKNGDDFRVFHTGTLDGTPLGSVNGDKAISLDGQKVIVDAGAVAGVLHHSFGAELGAGANGLGQTGSGVDQEQLFVGGIAANDLGEFESLVTDPNLAGVGTLTIDRDNMEVTANIVADGFVPGQGTLGADPFFLDTNAADSAFFDDNTFGIAHNEGFEQTANVGFALASGEAVLKDPGCECQFMHWGAWAGGEISPNGPENSVSDIGFFFAGVPTVDMPLSGTATFNGKAFASMAVGADTPFAASGAFELTTNFANGVSAGQMDLANQNFAIVGNHTPGSPNLAVQYLQNAQNVGVGAGRFFGPQAANVGVTVDINGNGIRAAGVAVGERVNP